MAIVYDNKTNRVSDKKTMANKMAPVAVPNSMGIGEEANRFTTNPLKTTPSKSSIDKDNDDEEKISKVFGKMLPLIEELERYTIRNLIPPNKT